MTQFSDRRILTHPAVHPCQSISPAILLRSLITLAREIDDYRSEPFPIHSCIIREALREVGALLAFLEDVRDRGSHLPNSVVLTFSDLHVTFQQMRHLLSDCARRGARLWILMNSDMVSSELRIYIRSIATVFDVTPLSSIDADQEVKEMVQLVARQAWKVAIGTDPADDQAARAVRSILNQFESGIAPAPGDLKHVLKHLHIRNWVDCSEEISFLEEEILASSDEKDGKTVLIGNLMGFMIYSRSTLFDVNATNATRSSNGSDQKKESKFRESGLDRLNPENLRCPISLELMMYPVTICTGQTYDQVSIARWLQSGCLTCPVTGEKLTNSNLIPNFTLQKLIWQYCHHNNIPITDQSGSNRRHNLAKTRSPGSPAAAGATRMAAAFLVAKLSNGTKEEKNRAAFEIRLLSKTNLFHRACLIEADSVTWLLHLLSSSDPSTQDNAVAALLNLSKHPAGRKAIFEIGRLSLVVDIMKEGLKVEAQQNAAAILFYLSSVEEYRKEIGEIPEAIPALVELLRKGSYRGKKNAIVTLFGLLLSPVNHAKILSVRMIIPALADLLNEEKEDLVNDCVEFLAKIAERKEGTNAILRSSSVVLPLLVGVLQSSTSRSGREHCVSVLLSLCNNGGAKVVGLLENMPLLMPSLYSLLTGGSPKACKKAKSLLNHIHHFHEQGYPAAAMTPPVQDHIVHAL